MRPSSKRKENTETDFDGQPDHGWKAAARQIEQKGDVKQAIGLYESVLKKQPTNAYLYDRLMILYHKEKNYKKELSIVKTAIEKFSTLLRPPLKNKSGRVASLSKSILHSVGLTDRKGGALFQPQPIARWEKRRASIKKRLALA